MPRHQTSRQTHRRRCQIVEALSPPSRKAAPKPPNSSPNSPAAWSHRQPKAGPITTDIDCDECGKPMVIRDGRRGKFLGCSGYPKCKNTAEVPAKLVEEMGLNGNGASKENGEPTATAPQKTMVLKKTTANPKRPRQPRPPSLKPNPSPPKRNPVPKPPRIPKSNSLASAFPISHERGHEQQPRPRPKVPQPEFCTHSYLAAVISPLYWNTAISDAGFARAPPHFAQFPRQLAPN